MEIIDPVLAPVYGRQVIKKGRKKLMNFAGK